MQRLRAVLKRCLAYALYFSGALWVYRRVVLHRRAVVLTYHRVLPVEADSFSSSGIVVSPRVFAANMRFLKRFFVPLSADEFQSCLELGRIPAGACLVTFDDGWYDNEEHALPILREFGVPMTLFVATGFVGSDDTFWQERLTRQLFELSRSPEACRRPLELLGIADVCDVRDDVARHRIRDFVTRLKSSTVTEIDRIAAAVTNACRQVGLDAVSFGDDRFLDWQALSSMAATGLVTVAAHGHSHVPLPRLGREDATIDLQRSVREIERRGLPRPAMCAYPNGDYDAATLDCPSEAGLKFAFTTKHGYVRTGEDPRCLPRVNIHEGAASTAPEFLCRILGIL